MRLRAYMGKRVCQVCNGARLRPEILGVTIYPHQAAILRALTGEKRRVAVRACHSVGKDFSAACALLWFACWTVTGLYAQTEARFFRNRLTLLTGVRYEKTHDKGVGPVNEPAAVWLRDPDGTFARNAANQRIRKPEAGLALR